MTIDLEDGLTLGDGDTPTTPEDYLEEFFRESSSPDRKVGSPFFSILITIGMQLLSQCRDQQAEASEVPVSNEEALEVIRNLPRGRRRRAIKKALIDSYDTKKDWRDAGGEELVRDALKAFDSSDDDVALQLMIDSE